MLILGIDTSGKTASVALYENGVFLAQNSLFTNRTHSQVIMPLAKKMLDDTDKSMNNIEIISVSTGPGSYTGLRIGISAVKAMAYALEIPCCGISSLEALAYNMLGYNSVVCSVMKARSDLYYTASFFASNSIVKRLTDDRMLSGSELINELSQFKKQVILVGDGADEFKAQFNKDFLSISPAHLKYQLASSLCLAALNHEKISPFELNANYLQLTKAEKDLYSL